MLRLVHIRKDIHFIKSCVSNVIICYKGRRTQCCYDNKLGQTSYIDFFLQQHLCKGAFIDL